MIEFRSTEELFPLWLTARPILQMWVDSVEGWGIEFDRLRGAAHLHPRSRFDISSLVPPEDWALAQSLFAPVADDVAGRIQGWFNSLPTMIPDNDSGMALVQSEASRIECELEAEGRGALRDRLSRAMGLQDSVISHIEMRVVLR
jgi:hypothetical protein